MEKLCITDLDIEQYRKVQPLIRIHEQHYIFDFDDKNFKEGDMVIDRKDGAYGVCEMVRNGKCAVNDNGAAELGVPLDRLIKLKSVLSDKLQRKNDRTGIFDL